MAKFNTAGAMPNLMKQNDLLKKQKGQMTLGSAPINPGQVLTSMPKPAQGGVPSVSQMNMQSFSGGPEPMKGGVPSLNQVQTSLPQPQTQAPSSFDGSLKNLKQQTGQSFKDQFGIKKADATNLQKNLAKDFLGGNFQPGDLTAANVDQFTGKGGKIQVDQNQLSQGNLSFLNKDKMIGQNRALSESLIGGPALQEASNFQYDLPESNIPQVTNDLQNQAAGANAAGGQLVGQGAGDIGSSINNLLGVQAGQTAAANRFGQDRETQLAQLQELQQQALNPDAAISPEARQRLQADADARRAEVQNIGNDMNSLFDRQVASDAARMANTGVLDSITASNTLGRRSADLDIAKNQLFQKANEQSRQDLINEATGLRGTAQAGAGLFGGLGSASGGLVADLLGKQSQTAGQTGQLGLGQAGLGVDLMKTGQAGNIAAGQLGLAGREQEANLQTSELGQRLLGDQTTLQNSEAYRNSQLNRNVTRQQMALQEELLALQQNNPGLFSQIAGLLGGGAGLALGGPVGGIAGAAIGKGVGSFFQ